MKRAEVFVLAAAAAATLSVVAFVAGKSRSAATSSSTTSSAVVKTASLTPLVALADFLPRACVRDGSVDYTVYAQTAIDSAAGGTLLLPDFPVRVSKRKGFTHCLLATKPIAIVGSAGSALVETDGGAQVLRVENAKGVRLEGFTLRGKGGAGKGLGLGILQVFGGEDVRIENVSVEDSDADGIVVADARNVRVTGCRAVRISKSAIYLSRCVGGVVSACVVEDVVGHRTAQGMLVGTGIQLSSNVDVACTGNVVRRGVGIGILCDANSTNVAPAGTAIVGNTISDFQNDENPGVSSGIRLQNSSPDTTTRTLVASNVVARCGWYGIYVENHGGASILGNSVAQSARSGILVATCRGATVANNVIQDADVAHTGNAAAVHLINGASGIVVRGNSVGADSGLGSLVPLAINSANGADNSIERRVLHLATAPVSGRWTRGDVVYSTTPAQGGVVGWVCISGGDPGQWAGFGKIE